LGMGVGIGYEGMDMDLHGKEVVDIDFTLDD
jgi:hypothetical protein